MTFRITSAAVAILFYVLQSSPLIHASSTSIIDQNGIITRTSIPESSLGSKGIVAIISSPGTKSYFDESQDNNDDNDDDNNTNANTNGVTIFPYNNNLVSMIQSPGATLSGTTSLSKGHGAAAASRVANSIIFTGITESDLEYGLQDSRHGQTLTNIFRSKIETLGGGDKEEEEEDNDDEKSINETKLFLVLPNVDDEDLNEDMIKNDIQAIFDTVMAENNVGNDVSFEDMFELNLVKAETKNDAKKIMDLAVQNAVESSPQVNILSSISDAYASANKATEVSSLATAALLACDDSFARQYRTARAKLNSWKSRTARGLIVDNFGSSATQLMSRCMEAFDRDTLIATGATSSAAAGYRLEIRSKLQGRIESALRELFKVQVELLEKSTLKKFNAMLLRQHAKDNVGKEEFYNENAAAVRAAAFSFEAAVEEVEVPSLSLTKASAVSEIDKKLNTALYEFPDSPAARLKNMGAVSKAVNKRKKPSERKIDVGLDFVAMLRPDGFGNLQGFAGYQLGGNNIIVGVHNDADAPDVISQFGGKRPPFVRVQPKLKLDIEL